MHASFIPSQSVNKQTRQTDYKFNIKVDGNEQTVKMNYKLNIKVDGNEQTAKIDGWMVFNYSVNNNKQQQHVNE